MLFVYMAGMPDSDFFSDSDSAIDSRHFSPIVSVFTDSKFAYFFIYVQRNPVQKQHEFVELLNETTF